tara:strand:+ start:45 stop:443 length:399 start_codon:yes stop_codon:yes gene_type:complete
MEYITSKEIEELGFTIQRGLVGVEVGVANLELRMNERTAEVAKQTDAIIKLTAAILSLGNEDGEKEQTETTQELVDEDEDDDTWLHELMIMDNVPNDGELVDPRFFDNYDCNVRWALDMKQNGFDVKPKDGE